MVRDALHLLETQFSYTANKLCLDVGTNGLRGVSDDFLVDLL